MDDILTRFIGPLVRWGLAIVAGFFAQRGFTFDENFWADTALALTAALAALLWSLWQKYAAAKLAKAALVAPSGTPMAVVKASVGSTV